ncbi:MAG: hypothetical protein JOZ31_02225 [Verrucomicrobia bacterium]|nr:hypothetical protein [Verrucomicrobiota bacterium]
MKNSPNKLIFHADGRFSVRIAGKWRSAVSKLTRTEYMALPYEAKKRLLLAEFETGREMIENTRLMVARL